MGEKMKPLDKACEATHPATESHCPTLMERARTAMEWQQQSLEQARHLYRALKCGQAVTPPVGLVPTCLEGALKDLDVNGKTLFELLAAITAKVGRFGS